MPQVVQWGPGTSTLAIVAGIILGNTAPPSIAYILRSWRAAGRTLATATGSVLYGFRLSFAATVMATAPVVKAPGDEIDVAASVLVVFGTTAMSLIPDSTALIFIITGWLSIRKPSA